MPPALVGRNGAYLCYRFHNTFTGLPEFLNISHIRRKYEIFVPHLSSRQRQHCDTSIFRPFSVPPQHNLKKRALFPLWLSATLGGEL